MKTGRYTAMWHLRVLDENLRPIGEERPFIGTVQEAAEELEAEFLEHHDRTGRHDELMRAVRLCCQYGDSHRGFKPIATLQGRDRHSGFRRYEIERTTPLREEQP